MNLLYCVCYILLKGIPQGNIFKYSVRIANLNANGMAFAPAEKVTHIDYNGIFDHEISPTYSFSKNPSL